jgi:hypothetical protein
MKTERSAAIGISTGTPARDATGGNAASRGSLEDPEAAGRHGDPRPRGGVGPRREHDREGRGPEHEEGARLAPLAPPPEQEPEPGAEHDAERLGREEHGEPVTDPAARDERGRRAEDERPHHRSSGSSECTHDGASRPAARP